MKLKKTIGAMALATLFATMGASAAEKNITVTATVDPTIDLLQTNGSALPDSIELTYSPASKNFEIYTLNTAVYTNDPSKGIVVRLSADPKLTNITDSTEQIPMTVTLGGQELSTSEAIIDADSLNFGANGVEGISSTQQLTIHADAQNTPPTAGHYQGMVSIVLTQST